LKVSTPYRQCACAYLEFAGDFVGHKGEDKVDREGLLRALSGFLKANKLKADWQGIENAPNEALVNALAMMAPFGQAEKQALLEAPDLKTRTEILIAVTEIELAKQSSGGETPRSKEKFIILIQALASKARRCYVNGVAFDGWLIVRSMTSNHLMVRDAEVEMLCFETVRFETQCFETLRHSGLALVPKGATGCVNEFRFFGVRPLYPAIIH